ncbi:putative death-receptor fusion protein-domain-containing protein [Microdochium bolleyi]|uniref:Putative death-receptor fusion protein-domain-containing protein n=1 Tax=Microdochium bolleyi TaxID=196109 RepID=A0A136JK61_9PEZI|nr:putative death-receptor fusion protein-domain-containing protein [Microdochium bolleyi]
MATEGLSEMLKGVEESSFNPKHAVVWLEQQPEDAQTSQVNELFQALLLSAAKPKQTSGNACVKLCGLVELSARSASPKLKDFAFAEDIAATMFNFFVEWNEQDAHRSMRLVLDFLVVSATQNPSPQARQSIKSRILNETVSIITEKSSRPSIKSALTALDHILQKKLVNLSDVLAAYQTIHKSTTNKDKSWHNFTTQVFDWMVLHYVCPAAGKLIVTILTNEWSEDGQERHPPSTWHSFISPSLKANPELLEPIRLYILIPLFKADRTGALEYLNQLTSLQGLTGDRGEGWNLDAMLWLSMLEAGKKVGVVDEPGQGLKQKPGAVAQLNAHILEEVLCHESHEARSSAVAILIASPSTTRPYTPDVLNLLKKHLPSFHSDANSKFRYEVLGHSRNMIKRIHGALESVRREYEKSIKKAAAKAPPAQGGVPAPGVSDVEATLRQHRDFVFWYLNFLKDEMNPTASYQRHITALKAMSFVLSSPLAQESELSMFGEGSSHLVDSDWLRCVLDLVMDPFDDVRDAAAVGGVDMGSTLATFSNRADKLASRTARADHSDGAARSFHLLHLWRSKSGEPWLVPNIILDDLEKKISSAEKDLAAAVLDAPVHGNFATLRYLWNSLAMVMTSPEDSPKFYAIQERTINCCQKIWEIVQHILCDDSPEGHLPEELEEVDGLDTKDLLSYSFRAIHESSNLLRVIASRLASESRTKTSAQSRARFELIGRLTFQELSNLRHRGAFTTVSQTFATCCQLVQHFPSGDDSVNLLNEWYQGALQCIHTQASTTRRSAGIPALIVGVLSANADEPSFDSIVRELQRISRRPARVAETDGSNLSQVHALNCLKDIFKSSHLGKRAEPYLTECLELAAECLKSEVWAIRNCGLLMLRSLIDCLLGTNESKASIEAGWDGKTTRIPYHKFPQLPGVLVNLLQMGQQAEGVLIGSQSAESVFPALDIIRRAGPPEAARDDLYSLISWYLGSRIWHVREIAARTLCSFLLGPGWVQNVRELILASVTSANKLHGALMTVKFLLERLSEVMPEQISGDALGTLMTTLLSIESGTSVASSCTEVQAVYVEVVNRINGLRMRQQPTNSEGEAQPGQVALPRHITDSGLSDSTSALLHLRLGEAQTHVATLLAEGIATGGSLKSDLLNALRADVNVSCAMLDNLSALPTPTDKETFAVLLDANLTVCLEAEASEPIRLALHNVSSLMGEVLGEPAADLTLLPTTKDLVRLWEKITRPAITPSLSEAMILVGGCILATVIARDEEANREKLPAWLRTWGIMMATAGTADQTFDTRISAASAMVSISTVLRSPPQDSLDQAHLPWLIALYDSLNDDDDEVRQVAATAAGNLLGQSLASIEASVRLLSWLCAKFGKTMEFQTIVAWRMVGHETCRSSDFLSPATTDQDESRGNWASADEQLRVALQPDDALFVVEEQNLYIDEVRETQRWRAAFATCATGGSSSINDAGGRSAILVALSSWTLSSLQSLNHIAAEQKHDADNGSDGPLGWTSKPAVYALCCRILTCGVALLDMAEREAATGRGGVDSEIKAAGLIRGELVRFREEGRKAEVHGLLLAICDKV